MGIDLHQSGNQQRAASCEETLWDRTHRDAAGNGDQGSVRALVHGGISGGCCRPRSATRRGEVLALRRSDIQDGRATIARSLTQTKQVLEFKGTKSERPRVVKIPESTLTTLDTHRKHQDEFRHQFGQGYKADLDLIFANPDGTPLKPDSISATVSLLFRWLKLPKGASLHSLRHTHTSHLLADGVSLPVVSARLGHSSVRVTAEIYSHMIHGQDDEAARRWEDYQRRNLPEKQSGGVQ